MATPTSRRRTPATQGAGRFARKPPAPPQGRFQRSTSTPQSATRFTRSSPTAVRQKARARKQVKQPSGGLGGLVSGALSALPLTGGKPAKKGGSKKKPAFALLAAGAGLIARQRMSKRSEPEVSPVAPPPTDNATPTS